MAHSYTPGLKVLKKTIFKKERILPLKGDVLVKSGDQLTPDTIVASTNLPGNVQMLKVSNILNIDPKDVVEALQVKEGQEVKKGDIILAIPSNGLHSNGYSLVRSIIKKNKVPKNLKKEFLKPTKIYSKEILKAVKKDLINAAAHITGGGLIENLLRSIPKDLTLNIDLSKIKIAKIFKWLKNKNISDQEMLRTFNCGVGFCLIVKKKNIKKIKKLFSKNFMPYEIGYVSKSRLKINLLKSLRW